MHRATNYTSYMMWMWCQNQLCGKIDYQVTNILQNSGNFSFLVRIFNPPCLLVFIQRIKDHLLLNLSVLVLIQNFKETIFTAFFKPKLLRLHWNPHIVVLNLGIWRYTANDPYTFGSGISDKIKNIQVNTGLDHSFSHQHHGNNYLISVWILFAR